MKTALAALAAAFTAATGVAVAQETGAIRPPMMMRADTYGDGVITRAELLAQAGERFDRMDLNHDGRLTADELRQWRPGPRDRAAPPPPRP